MNLLGQISERLFVPKKQLETYLLSAPKRYKRYEIDKKNGVGKRLIAHPSKSLKPIQRLGVELIRPYLSIHQCATAYEKGVGIRCNADKHKANPYQLKMDFKDFFPSITPDVLISMMKRNNLDMSRKDEKVLTHLFFWEKKRHSFNYELSIGAPSSPFISNAVMYEFDEAILLLCNSVGVSYTRYADDLTFSCKRKGVLFELYPQIIKIIEDTPNFYFLTVNKDKTVFTSKKVNRHITGVTITNEGTLSIGRERKRLISSMIDHCKKGLLESKEIEKLRGLLGFAKHIEPNFMVRMEKKYGSDLIKKIQKYQDN